MKALKVLLLSSLFALLSLITIAAINIDEILEHKRAIVDKEKSLFIFVNSMPVSTYESIGKVKAGMTMTGTYQQLKSNLINKTLKNYPEAEGIIIDVEDNCASAEVIKFKK